MRDYTFHQARFRDSTFAFPALRRVLRNWLTKRQLSRLQAMDDYLLHDIGLTRDDLRWGLSLPSSCDVAHALSERRDGRLRRGVRHS
ncbi:MAG: DUF1127 domain-containing protein [Alphaproteobacteria bacterium]|jgi:uncharacterized protein YjiS (DUF1127 family)|nr:DUF1127 domain-containing protein [Alphaproteobacteria bacterium]